MEIGNLGKCFMPTIVAYPVCDQQYSRNETKIYQSEVT